MIINLNTYTKHICMNLLKNKTNLIWYDRVLKKSADHALLTDPKWAFGGL
jgi:hypothetical protein